MAWPTTSNPRTEFVTVRFTKDEALELDALAAAEGNNRSEAVRVSVLDRIARHKRKIARRASKGAKP